MYSRQNCILADEMGLGKTIQSITFLEHVFSYGIRGPFLVIVPLSTLGNWQREFEAWTDLNVIVYHGSSASRNMLQQYEMFYKDEKVCAFILQCITVSSARIDRKNASCTVPIEYWSS
jgi:chromodomain-helicase-DNA-binding protein 7